MRKNKPAIKDYILANPSCTAAEVRKATGAERTSVHTVFTMLRKAYKTAGVNAAGLIAPEGYPPLTISDFEALCESRLNMTKRRKKVKKVKAAPAPETVREVGNTFKQPLLSDEEIHTMFAYATGKAEGLREAGGSADLAVMLVRNVEQWYGLR